jgi:hypothetical protein
VNSPRKSVSLFCTGVPEIAHLAHAFSLAIAFAVDVLWFRMM